MKDPKNGDGIITDGGDELVIVEVIDPMFKKVLADDSEEYIVYDENSDGTFNARKVRE